MPSNHRVPEHLNVQGGKLNDLNVQGGKTINENIREELLLTGSKKKGKKKKEKLRLLSLQLENQELEKKCRSLELEKLSENRSLELENRRLESQLESHLLVSDKFLICGCKWRELVDALGKIHKEGPIFKKPECELHRHEEIFSEKKCMSI